MMVAPLQLQSERYAETGSMAADGVRRLLGAPGIDRLQTVIRETVQNTNDAATSGGVIPEYRVRLRTLSPDQLAFLRDVVFRDFPDHDASATPLGRFLQLENPCVLEICDFGTSGLGGPTRTNAKPEDGESTDFLDFMRNLGSNRDTHLGGGTYGFGKASLYLSGRCSTILVDSVARASGVVVRRFMGSHIGEAYTRWSGEDQGRFTGRHWWGRMDRDGVIEPETGDEARMIAESLGMPDRGLPDSGTSVMILDPEFEDDDPDDTIGRIQEALLWHFWPKMVRDENGDPAMHFTIEHEGDRVPIPDIETVAPLSMFAESFRRIRDGHLFVESIDCERPVRHLGNLSIVTGRRRDRRLFVSREAREGENHGSLIPDRCAHLAVMRPTHLVVRYFEGALPANPDEEWCGCFICSEEEDVERAFAAAEPPAHDDWNPTFLPPRSWTKRYVNVALRKIGERLRNEGMPADIGEGDPHRTPLATAADRLGLFLPHGDRIGRKPQTSIITPRSRQLRVFGPEFVGLEERGEETDAIFSLTVQGRAGATARLKAAPALIIEGGEDTTSPAPNGRRPVFMGWEDEDGNLLCEGDTIDLAATPPTTVRARVQLPDYVAVTVQVQAQEVGE